MASNRVSSFKWMDDLHQDYKAECVPTSADDEVVLSVNPGTPAEVSIQVPYPFLLEVLRVMKNAETEYSGPSATVQQPGVN